MLVRKLIFREEKGKLVAAIQGIEQPGGEVSAGGVKVARERPPGSGTSYPEQHIRFVLVCGVKASFATVACVCCSACADRSPDDKLLAQNLIAVNLTDRRRIRCLPVACCS